MRKMSTDIQTIMKINVPLIVTVGSRRISVEDVLGLAPGSIVELNKDADEPLDILVNNKQIGTGESIKVGENFGVRLLDVMPPDQRVAAMGE